MYRPCGHTCGLRIAQVMGVLFVDRASLTTLGRPKRSALVPPSPLDPAISTNRGRLAWLLIACASCVPAAASFSSSPRSRPTRGRPARGLRTDGHRRGGDCSVENAERQQLITGRPVSVRRVHPIALIHDEWTQVYIGGNFRLLAGQAVSEVVGRGTLHTSPHDDHFVREVLRFMLPGIL